MTVTCALLPPSASSSSTSATISSTASMSSSAGTTRMGRRKQHCPQKTGIAADQATASAAGSTQEDEENGRGESKAVNDGGSDSASVSGNSDKDVTMPTLESLEPETTSNGLSARNPTTTPATTASPNISQEEALSNMLKSPLLNPALLTINPSLYAMQLAQLQAALAQNAGLAQHLAAAGVSAASTMPKSNDADLVANMRKRKMDEDDSVLNLSKKSPISSPKIRAESPLDLSGNRMGPMSPSKAAKLDPEGKLGLPWAAAAGSFPFISPFLSQEAMSRFSAAAAAAAARMPPTSSPPTSLSTSLVGERNPLERMSEIAKSGGHNAHGRGGAGGPRHSAWQSQWLNRGPEANKDIFKCSWCKESYPNLQALTAHIKETRHFGPPASPSAQAAAAAAAVASKPAQSPTMHGKMPSLTPPTSSTPTSVGKASRDILKEQLPMPRKLVRGQDVWLGKGEQQTKDILKCMWCGESFRSLELMTKHMQETKHYTKVISQEQLSTWRATESQPSSQNHVNAVLTCKVCEQPFSTLKDLSEHMVKNNHYKDTMRPGVGPDVRANPAAAAALALGANAARLGALGRPEAKEKRKKSLPVRKLLELERAQQELSGHIKSPGDDAAGKISCEKCGEKILMQHFVDHIRQCVGPLPISRPSSESARSTARSPSVSPPRSSSDTASIGLAKNDEIGAKSKEEPKSILGSLEKMVQNNFGAKKKTGPENNLSILQRLGIDEGVDYSKPLVDPLAMFRPPSLGSHGFFFPGRNASETRSNSECSSPDRFKAERPASLRSESSEVKSPAATSARSDTKSPPKEEDIKVDDDIDEKPEENEQNGDAKDQADNRSNHSKGIASPVQANSPQRSSTPNSHKADEASSNKPDDAASEEDGESTPKTTPEKPAESNGKKKENPLAALQMLCDKTEKTPKSTAVSSSSYGGSADPGAILAFSWACNQAVVNDSLLKCPFCDTPFISKGAYRHHLSKMHFVKDGSSPDPKALLGAAAASNAASKTPEKSPTPTGLGSGSGDKEENAQSKFAKYSQLAKQLSCSSQP